jgi:hypothetical protein
MSVRRVMRIIAVIKPRDSTEANPPIRDDL